MGLAIELRDVSKEYVGVMALNKINLKVHSGTVHGFLGPNGAGKSTAMRIIAGLLPPTSGSVFVDGVNALKDIQKIKNRVGILPENIPLYSNMKVGEYLTFCRRIHLFSQNGEAESIHSITERCGLGGVRNRLIGNLSKGYKQRVGIAQSLVYGAKIIILDEPTVGLDPHAIRDIRDLILELKREHTLLLSTHQLHEVNRICDEITIINKGSVLKTGSLSEVQNEFQSVKTYDFIHSKFDEDLKRKLENKSYISGVELRESENSLEEGMQKERGEDIIRLNVNSRKDYREDIIQILFEKEGLRGFWERKLELEEIFEKVVRK